jgi:hypothetical protein
MEPLSANCDTVSKGRGEMTFDNFDASPKDEKDKTCAGDTQEDAENKELKFSFINYIISVA